MKALETEELVQHLNRQTSKISWHELERYYAQGAVFFVESELDLISVAADFIQDNADNIKQALDKENIRAVSTEEAQLWHDENKSLWGVVAAPWVLVQNIKETEH